MSPSQQTRREFLTTIAAAAGASALHAQTPAPSPWKTPVIDCHLHLRRDAASNIAHMDGSGVSKALLLARESALEQLKGARTQYPGRVTWAVSTDIASPEAQARLAQAVKDGAFGIAEMKFHLAADSAEFQRAYALAGELDVPIMIHFQEVPHFEGEGVFATGFKQFEAMLKKFPKTRFIGHADAFWANVDARYANEASYPSGPINRGGVTDKLLGDYANLYGDLAANSGNNALSRDPSFTPDFLKRHQDKLIFGSDCSCADGKGSGVAQANNPAASRLAGKCVARETLTLLQSSVSPEIFRKLVWENAHRTYRLPT